MTNQRISLLDRARCGDLTADILYPRRRGGWPVRFVTKDGLPAYGVFEPQSGVSHQVDPKEDPELRRLAKWIEKGELRSYRATQRAVIEARIKGSRVFVKILPKKRAAAGRAAILTIAAEESHRPGSFPRTPRLVLDDADRGVLVLAEVSGSPWHDQVMKGRSGRSIADVAGALASWHWQTRSSNGMRLETDFATWIGYSALEDDGFVDRLRPIASRLAELERTSDAGPFGRVHGDLHDKNIFIDPSFGTGFIDIDGVRDGAVASDVGNLAAHLYLRAIQRGESAAVGAAEAESFLAAHAAHRKDTVHPARLVVATTLFRIACLYRFRRRWRELALPLLEAADRWKVDT